MISIRREAPAPPALLDAGAKELAKWPRRCSGTQHLRRAPMPEENPHSRSRRTAQAPSGTRSWRCSTGSARIASRRSSRSRRSTSSTGTHKGRIKSEEGPMYEGYAWLAADWHNLVAACPNCNRPTKHPLPGGGVTAGKGMRFPLATARTKDPDNTDPAQVDSLEPPELGACRVLTPDGRRPAEQRDAGRSTARKRHTAETYAIGDLPEELHDDDYDPRSWGPSRTRPAAASSRRSSARTRAW